LSKLIADAEASGAFIATEGNVTSMVTIEPAFYSFDFAKKQQLAAIIYDWALAFGRSLAEIRDASVRQLGD
jgi:hypothetical protein